ncbi:hypothetical protein [Paenibacillus crassostreae]|uniref:CD-NTase associated protein 4-like DNA endonuclease domain-containing protein n=1 Tax=Paenibacillus crassostreae TaxID=1763538 RepID=A0A167EHZ8_9BACL|nr:hypothetical protein [Paenibacillus crassostreae]AOZ94880.1 hypothetical protein LPB68_21695 [Paenibacillus crassostreae]OAB75563.1 hypothetical protein PNBC_07985 [Paenibacillus crassostreae]
MCKTDVAVNAGVHNSTGLEFQKHCALLFIIEDYENLKDRDYFLSIEHHDDILFCFRDKNNDINFVNSYQVKKASSEWTMSEDLFEIIKKITIVGDKLINEDFPRSLSYSHKLYFATNHAIKLNNGKRKKGETKNLTINEANNEQHFALIDQEIRDKIISQMELNGFKTKQQLSNVYLSFVDLPKTTKSQLAVLIGRCEDLLGDKISDSKAVIDTLLKMFRKIENTFNQENQAKILDESKRIDSNTINDVFNIVTKKKMAFSFWRAKAETICNDLNLFVNERKSFVSYFENSFDLFKDLEQGEHQRILKFVTENLDVTTEYRTHIECVTHLCEKFFKSIDSQLSKIEIKAAIYAAYVEMGDIDEY